MKKHTFIWSIMMLLYCLPMKLNAQVVYQPGTPYSFDSQLKKSAIPLKVMPEINLAKLRAEDADDIKGGQAPRFGVLHEVNYTLNNSGLWEILPNGDRLWRLRIKAPEARTINMNYNKFDLPAGAKLFIYSSPKPSTVLGPFTADNERSNNRFATGFTHGAECTIEYYEPAAVEGQGEIEIDGIVHGYRSIPNSTSDILKNFNDSGSCNYDVDCAIGNGWEDQIKSVGMHLLANGTRFCSGALINNTANDCKPYFLTANHCFGGTSAGARAGDILNDIFMFNYHSPTPACPGTPNADGPTNQTVVGGTVLSNAATSDFFLIELDDNPLNFYDVYYSGWNRATSGTTNTTAIHHPAGDVKKFSVDNDAPIDNNSFWTVVWEQGTTEGGSSGSPLFDQNKRIIGQLWRGSASCNNPNGTDDYGSLAYSWNSNGSSAGAQVQAWLDPQGTGVMIMDGSNCSTPVPPVANFAPTNNSSFTGCTVETIEFTDQSAGNPTSWSWFFSGAGVSPTSSNIANPTVTVSSTGMLSATLTVTNGQGNNTLSQTYNVEINPCVSNTFCESPNVSIPENDASGVSSNLSIPASGSIIDINVDIDINHTYVGDLIIELSHNGTTVVLLDRNGCSSNDIDGTFDDEGSIPNTTCTTPLSGLIIPDESLTAFDGLDQTGIWTLSVSDNADVDVGTLNEWCLEITTASGSNCYSMLTNANGLTTFEVGVADYESEDWIETTSTTAILPGAQVDYDAVDYIHLGPEFQVLVGGVFNAFIDGCNNGAGGVNLIQNDSNSIESDEIKIDKN